MAAITSSAVTNVRSWRVPVMGGPNHYHRIVDVVLAAQGGTVGDIPASVLGFATNQLISVGFINFTGNLAYIVCLSSTADSILTNDPSSGNSNPGSVTGTLRVHVVGLEAN